MLIWVLGTGEMLERPEAGCVSQYQPPRCCRLCVLGTAASFLQEDVPEARKPVTDAIAANPGSLERRALCLHVMIANAPFGLF